MTCRSNCRDHSATPIWAAFLVLAFGATCAAREPWRDGMQNAELAQAQSEPFPSPQNGPEQTNMNPPPLTAKQQREILKAKYEKMKQEASELAVLAKSLQQDLEKSNSDVLSLKVIDKADKIEKLAKRIKSEAVQ